MKNNRSKTILISATISLVIAIILFVFSFYLLKNINTKSSILSKEIAQRELERENISQFKKIIKDTEEKHAQIDSFIIENTEVDQFVSALEQEGDKLGVPINIGGVNLSNANQNRLVVLFDADGSFESLTKLLWIIENMPYKIEIKSASLRAGEKNWTLNVNIELAIK